MHGTCTVKKAKPDQKEQVCVKCPNVLTTEQKAKNELAKLSSSSIQVPEGTDQIPSEGENNSV